MGYHGSVAQNSLSQSTQVEINMGWVTPFLQSGSELTRAENIRSNRQSYFANDANRRRDVGSYPALSGISFGIGFYKPLRWAKGLMLGAVVRNSQTGSQPEEGGYEEGYFFNFLTAGATAKYYPFEANNLFLLADLGLAAVFTKNRFENESREQEFFHQFGIGSGGSIGMGYAFTPFHNKEKALELKILYQQLSTRVEVNEVGNDQWQFGAFHIGGSYNF